MNLRLRYKVVVCKAHPEGSQRVVSHARPRDVFFFCDALSTPTLGGQYLNGESDYWLYWIGPRQSICP